MRVERVVAHAFGPLKGETLELAPGMTVICGPNEAGKTSWHAAIRAAVCGVRRSRGRATTVDAAFEQRHRPWDDPERWEVEARLALDDGRTIEIVQDLAGKVACRATDVVLGRDVSDEIMDGTPDGSRWLGLDRDAFAATICVSQAQITSIADRDTAASLQDHMQRAAATRGTDATAAEARERLDGFRRAQVGVDRQGARGPLRSALTRLANAQGALAEARRRHVEYLDASAAAEAAERAAGATAERVAVLEAAMARRVADAARRRAERAAELSARHQTPPGGSAERDERADDVASALEAWARRPQPEPLAGPSSAELEAELAALPRVPQGDTDVHPSVTAALRQLDSASEALRLHGPRPAARELTPAAADPDRLRGLARRLRTPEPDPRPDLESELAAARAELARATDGGPRLTLLAAGALAAAGLAALLLDQALVGVALVALALGAGALAWRGGRAERVGSIRVARAAAALAPAHAARDHAMAERAAASAELGAAGLPSDPNALEVLADAQATAQREASALVEWDRTRERLEARRADAEASLLAALDARGADASSGTVEERVAAYESACRRRSEGATLAARAGPLRQALEARRAAEAGLAAARGAAAEAEAALRSVAVSVGIEGSGIGPDELDASLREWRVARADDLRRSDAALAEWRELSVLLDGGSLEQLRAEAESRGARAGELESALGASAALPSLAGRDDLEALLSVERDEHARARREADGRAGALEQMRRELPDVAEAEEAQAEASAERERVEALSGILETTLRLLRAAEERVHRDLAPILAGAVRRWLPSVTGGAYADVSVDPADLSVRVKEASSGRWRSALILSEGTREQIYLLLRVAMAQHLVTTGETAPLLLDEVTAQADPDRTAQLLEMLRGLSDERQVVLFTHDPNVATWAEDTFDGERNRLVMLPGRVAKPAPAAPLVPAADAIPLPISDGAPA